MNNKGKLEKLFHKFLPGVNAKAVTKQKKSRFHFSLVISVCLVFSVLIIGIVCLFFGIRDTYKLNKSTKGYLTTEGYFRDYHIYNADQDGTTYQLIYVYEVDGNEYTVATDYGVGYIPAANSVKEIKYNPDNHREAMIVGTNSSNFLIYFGAFFTLGGMVFVLAALYMKGVFDKVKINVMGVYAGFVILIMGIGIILFQNGTTSSFIETIQVMGFWFFIPLLLIVMGIFQIIKCLLGKK